MRYNGPFFGAEYSVLVGSMWDIGQKVCDVLYADRKPEQKIEQKP